MPNFFYPVLACFWLFICGLAAAEEKVVLQLQWDHEFQFAGYYAALWQGYYESEGLNVEIRSASRPDGSLISPPDEIINNRADFAIGALDILIHKDRGEPLVVLAPIFQRSPNSLFALSATPLNSLEALANLKIGSNDADYTSDEIRALFNVRGINPDTVELVNIRPGINALIEGKVDAIATYGISASFQAQEKGIALNQLPATEQELNFYGDTLYTHQRVIDQKPEVVGKFIRATLKGWEYALNNKAEIAGKISHQLPRQLADYDNLEAYNLAFADIIENYMAYPVTAIGHLNKARWRHMHEQLKSIGVLTQHWDESLLYDHSQPPIEDRETYLSMIGFLICTIVAITLAIIFLQRQRNIYLPAVFVLLALLLIETFIESYLHKDHLRKISLDTALQLNSISARIVGQMNTTLTLISSTAAYIGAVPQLDQAAFEKFIKTQMDKNSSLISIAAAPDMIVKLVYPMAGNEASIGLNYKEYEPQRLVAMQVKNHHQILIDGPVNLVQGGIGFVLRTGVYTENELGKSTSWGIVSAPIDAEKLYQQAGLRSPELTLDIAIRNNDVVGRDNDVFFGEPAIFADQQAITNTITLGNTSWTLAARPKQGWHQTRMGSWLLRISTVIIAAILLLFISYRYRQMTRSKAYEAKLLDNEKLLNEVGKMALIGAWKIDARGRILGWSEQTSVILRIAYPVQEVFRTVVSQVFPSDQFEQLNAYIEATGAGEAPSRLEIFSFDEASGKRWFKVVCEKIPGKQGDYEIMGAFQDISERKAITDMIQYQASYDALTGLANRALLNDRLNKAISKSQRDEKKLAVLFIDLDNFKPVNDNYGHAAGDILLQEVAGRIKSCIRDSDTAARYSGDEFAVILLDVDDGAASLTIAEQVIQHINQPFLIDDRQVFCSASIGIAIYPEDGNTSEVLISNADHAMYEVKKTGRNGWHYFTDEMQQKSEMRHKLHHQLLSAIHDRQLTVHYQPIIDLKTNRLAKCEALVRWFDKDNQQVPTEQFIGLAEEMGLVNDIDLFVLEQAGSFLIRLAREKGCSVGLSVNVSPRIFAARDKSLAKWLERVTAIARELTVTVEITERVLTQDSEKALHALNELKRAGVTIAIDDFGTGYSSLSYLTKFPIDYIKIDRSFIGNIGISRAAETLTETIIGLAGKLSLQVVAEGVETRQQLDFLQQLGCDYAQGYFLGRPQQASSLVAQLEAENAQQAGIAVHD